MIKVSHFYKSFAEKTVHEDVNFSVNNGECLGLLGGSGVGKSVILRSLIGLERANSGSIRIDDEEITSFNENEFTKIRKKVAYVFQHGALFDSMSVFDNLAYPLIEHTSLSSDEIRERVTTLLSDFNLEGSEDLLPAELSGGMQKRVGLARAIILNPKVVLYDEPTAGLDPANTIIIQELILKLKKSGSTAVLVTHDIDTALNVCDRICLLRGGKIINIGSLQQFKSDKNKLVELFLKEEK
ncbi:MAG: ABC transporter ATP-binding protein [Bdellovibrionales bacterium RBG_16_40_8]|nr:MAG: ABC transporter ATP-binding protein [Bdellovibrionales bacterium RBG_16_40_8]